MCTLEANSPIAIATAIAIASAITRGAGGGGIPTSGSSIPCVAAFGFVLNCWEACLRQDHGGDSKRSRTWKAWNVAFSVGLTAKTIP